MSAEELGSLLQIYLAEYSLYAVLLLTGALGSLTVLQLRATLNKLTRLGRFALGVTYVILGGVTCWSFWRLLQFGKSVDAISQRMNLMSLNLEVQGQKAGLYYFFQSVYGNMYWFVPLVWVLAALLFLFMWIEVENAAKCPSGA